MIPRFTFYFHQFCLFIEAFHVLTMLIGPWEVYLAHKNNNHSRGSLLTWGLPLSPGKPETVVMCYPTVHLLIHTETAL